MRRILWFFLVLLVLAPPHGVSAQTTGGGASGESLTMTMEMQKSLAQVSAMRPFSNLSIGIPVQLTGLPVGAKPS